MIWAGAGDVGEDDAGALAGFGDFPDGWAPNRMAEYFLDGCRNISQGFGWLRCGHGRRGSWR